MGFPTAAGYLPEEFIHLSLEGLGSARFRLGLWGLVRWLWLDEADEYEIEDGRFIWEGVVAVFGRRSRRFRWILDWAVIHRANSSNAGVSVCRWVHWYSNHLILNSSFNLLNRLFCVVSSSSDAREPGCDCLNSMAA